MKNSWQQAMVACLALGAGWCCGDLWLSERNGSPPVADSVKSPKLLNDRRDEEPLVSFDNRAPVSTDLLVDLADRIDRLNGSQLTRFREQVLHWHPLVQGLVFPLIQAREARLDPSLPRAVPPHIDHEELASLLSGGDWEKLGDWAETVDGAKVLECLRTGDFAMVFEIVDDGTLSWLCRELGKKNPRQAIEWIQQIKSHHRRQKAFKDLVSGWAREDPEAAMTWLESLNPGLDRDAMGDQLVQTLRHSNPEFGMKNIDRLLAIGIANNPQPAKTLFQGWVTENPEDALDWARGRDAAEIYLPMAVETLARTDLPRALGLYDELNIHQGGNTARFIVQAWLEKDPEAAGAWVRGLEDGELRTRRMLQIADYWVDRDPESALQWIVDSDPELHLVDAIRSDNFLAKISMADSGRAFEEALFERMLENQDASGTLRFFQQLSEGDPRQAATLLARMPNPEDKRMISAVATNWARDNPAEAAEWIAALPEGDARSTAAKQVVLEWIEFDLNAASSWANRHQPDLDSSVAYRLAESHLYAGEFQKAKVYADQIDNRHSQGAVLANLFRSWMDADSEAGSESYLQTDLSDLPLDVRENLKNVVFFEQLER